MDSVAQKIQDLRAREEKLREMGGGDAVARQHDRGKMTARERLDAFFDQGTFQELDIFVRHRGTLFGIERMEIQRMKSGPS